MDLSTIRSDFPIYSKDKNLVYLDSAAMSLKPRLVIDSVSNYYSSYSANVFRGLYAMSEKATEAYESSRETIAEFIGATDSQEVVFVRNTTEAVNLVAYAWGRTNISSGDEIVTTVMEHHSNFVPWQELCNETGATLKVINVDDEGILQIQSPNTNTRSKSKIKNQKNPNKHPEISLEDIVTQKTKLVAITHISNVLGVINPIQELVREVKRINPSCLVLVDGAQAVPHISVNVEQLGCDFYVFSGQKMLGPTGIGVLWGRMSLLKTMPPFLFGGSMIEEVTLEKTTFRQPAQKYEAGTPNIAGAIGLGTAARYLKDIGIQNITEHEQELTEYCLSKLGKLPFISIIGPKTSKNRSGVISFVIRTGAGRIVHPHDAGQILSDQGICVRVGHHCAMPLHNRFGYTGSIRASLYLYNTTSDVDKLISGIKLAQKKFQ